MIVVLLAAWLTAGVWQRLLGLWHLARQLLHPTAPPKGYRKIRPAVIKHRNKRKPDWVLQELIWLKAHAPDDTCRDLANKFNRRNVGKQMSVCKSTVHKLLRNQAHAVLLARREMRNKPPHPYAVNDVWGLDMTPGYSPSTD